MRQTPFRQSGNTLLGLIIGVLIGLGSALAVALYVTKVPIPFASKSTQRSPENEAAEAQKNKEWDPNAALAGKPAVRAYSNAPGASAPAAAAPGGLSAPAVAGVRPAVPAAPAIAPAVSADPLGDLARSRSTGVAVDPFTYFVQSGAYRTPEDAEAQRGRLALAGVDAKVTEREQSGRTVYRVRAGPFERKDEAERLRDRLEASGFESALVRIQR